jgi:putative N-acetyltransferase (TIGR04045 family)
VLGTAWVAVECRPAATSEELAAHHAVRHAVFVTDQRVFAESDRDPQDDNPRTLHVVGMVDDVVGGTVRLFPLDGEPGLWQGDRLAVLHEHRLRGLGEPLVRYAVRTAAELGGRRMVAHVQLPNVRFFERLGWHHDGDVEVYAGVPHQPMAIDLQR